MTDDELLALAQSIAPCSCCKADGTPIGQHADFCTLVKVEAALAAAQKRVGLLQGAVAFFASVIKSGEPWTQTCEDALRAALAGGTAGDGEQMTQQQQVKP